MHLLSPLVSGVANAGNGSASVFRRGTSTLATLYSSFEGDPYSSSGIDDDDRVILDSYGRAEVYVNEVVDVSVYSEAGTLQIAFTAGVAASSVEVDSQSFTGSAYDGSGTGLSRPTTLAAILDLWITTRGVADWGLAAGDAQPFFVVTDDAYGATGDGTTDDTVRVQAAILAAEAAGGGIVFFPAGTYRCTADLVLPTNGNNIVLLGAGADSTNLVINHASDSLLTLGNFSYCEIVGIFLNATISNTGNLIELATTGGNQAYLTLRDCGIGSANCKGNLIDATDDCVIRVENCEVTCGIGATHFIHVTGTDGTVVVTDSAVSFAGGAHSSTDGVIHGNDLRIRDCVFSAAGVSSGTLTWIKFNTGVGNMTGKVTGCNFIGSSVGSTDVICMDLATPGADSVFTEDNNRFDEGYSQYTTPSLKAYQYGGTTSRGVQLRTRDNRSILITDNNSQVAVPTDQYGVVIVKSTHAAVNLDGDRPPEGATGWVIFYHPSGGAGTCDLDQHFFGGTQAVTANTSTHGWQYVCCTVNATLRLMVTVDNRAFGNGA